MTRIPAPSNRSTDHFIVSGLINLARALAESARIALPGVVTKSASDAIDDFMGGLTDLIGDTLLPASTHGIDDEQDERRFDDPRADEVRE